MQAKYPLFLQNSRSQYRKQVFRFFCQQNNKNVSRFITVFFICLSVSLHSNAQIPDRVDSLVKVLCIAFESHHSDLDSEIVTQELQKHLGKYLSKMTDSAANDAITRIYLRLQVKCPSFIDFVNKTSNVNWVSVTHCPRSEATDQEIREFFKKKWFRYVEPSGDTTKLELTDQVWIDHMKDGTYSKLSLKRLAPAEFAIRFIESNHYLKSKLSKPGDTYYYSIISKRADHYVLCVSLPHIEGGTLFNVYFTQ